MLSLEYLLKSLLDDSECVLLYVDDGILVVDNDNRVVRDNGVEYVEVDIGEDKPALIRLDTVKTYQVMNKIDFVMASVEAMCSI